MKNWIQNSVVIVTGASSGIGKEITKLLINNFNCQVLGVARKEEKLKKLKLELGETQNKFEYLSLDVSKEESWKTLQEKAKEINANVLINNAGTMLPFLKANKISETDLQRVFNLNFMSIVFAYNYFREYFHNLGKDCGLINITSASAISCIPGQSIYSASKSAATKYSQIISSEEHKNFFVGTYLPGFTRTELFCSKDNSKPIFDEKSQRIVNKLSMPAEKLAKKIINSIRKKKRYKTFGRDTRLLKLLTKIMPSKSSDMCLAVFKKSKLECFEDLFE